MSSASGGNRAWRSQETLRGGVRQDFRKQLRTLRCAFSPAEYQTSIQEKLPLIIGSSAAGLVFLIAVVVIVIVCNRWVGAPRQLQAWLCVHSAIPEQWTEEALPSVPGTGRGLGWPGDPQLASHHLNGRH